MSKRLLIIACLLAAPVDAAVVSAAEKTNPDWPCVQRKIPALSAGMMWAGPPVDDAAMALWQSDAQLTTLAVTLAARRTSLDETEKLIAAYADTLAAGAKPQHLAALFAGVLDQVNKERQQIMAGIEKFTRKQQALADTVRKTRAQFAEALKVKAVSDEDKKARRDLEQKLNWQSRIYDEREKSLVFVCESPVLLEQRIFAIARQIANHLE